MALVVYPTDFNSIGPYGSRKCLINAALPEIDSEAFSGLSFRGHIL